MIVPQRIDGLQFVFGLHKYAAAILIVQPSPRFNQVLAVAPLSRNTFAVFFVLGQELLAASAHNHIQVAAHLAIDQLFGNIGADLRVTAVLN